MAEFLVYSIPTNAKKTKNRLHELVIDFKEVFSFP